MKINEILKHSEKGFSFEFFPPKTEKGRVSLSNTVDLLKKYNPLYVSMTYGAGGGSQAQTKDAVSMLLDFKDLEVMPHLTCIGSCEKDIKQMLDGYKSQGIENVMALRGDPPMGQSNFNFSTKNYAHASDLVRTLKQYNHFCVGVAVYPEGHIESKSLDQDMDFTKKKVDAGADFAVTQMFFDNAYYYALLERMSKKAISLPVLPGILPLTDVEKVKQFAAICRTTIPSDITTKMEKFRHNPVEMEKIGVEYTIKQCRDLINNGVKKIHFFTLNKPEIITAIIDAIQ
ncbi:MAG: methylenetetrahydrofolate reductase [NAD(P)H] [Candidatus Omnitrophica bacterium]|nr:methylenetetrahydrofolate reductase [NAD(P)H] [Candidatus Omnitrophota bacterium]